MAELNSNPETSNERIRRLNKAVHEHIRRGDAQFDVIDNVMVVTLSMGELDYRYQLLRIPVEDVVEGDLVSIGGWDAEVQASEPYSDYVWDLEVEGSAEVADVAFTSTVRFPLSAPVVVLRRFAR